MSGLIPYLRFDGQAREALDFYAEVFGGEAELYTFGQFGRDDGDPAAIAHGILTGPVELFASDAGAGESALRVDGLTFSLLGTADNATLTGWFEALAVGGEVIDPLQVRAWGDTDGVVRDRFGVPWLIGYEGADG